MRQRSDATSVDADASPYLELGHELERSRRYERSFALVRIRVDSAKTSSGNGAASDLVGRLETNMRSIDRVWAMGGDLVYLLPECDRERAAGFVRRLEDIAGSTLSATVASFPEDGVTGGSLIALLSDGADAGESVDSENGHNESRNGRLNGSRRFGLFRPRHGAKSNDEAESMPDPATVAQNGQPADQTVLESADKASS